MIQSEVTTVFLEQKGLWFNPISLGILSDAWVVGGLIADSIQEKVKKLNTFISIFSISPPQLTTSNKIKQSIIKSRRVINM